MDLKSFISESLYQIIAGIKAAQEKINELSGDEEISFNKAYIVPMPGFECENELHDVHFDIALTVSRGEPTQPSARLLVLGLSSLSGKGPIDQISSIASRIQFSVPVIYPAMSKQKTNSASFPHWH